MFGAADLDIFFKDFGVTVVAGAQTALALFDAPGEAIDLQSLAPVSGIDYAITFKTAALSNLQIRQQITVDGNPYQVSSIDPMDDGQITKAKLKSLGSPAGPGSGQPGGAGATLAKWGRKNFVETPDGVRTVFTLPSLPPDLTALQVFLDEGILSSPADYSVSGVFVTFTLAPPNGSVVFAYF